MKIFQKIVINKKNNVVKKYKFFGLTLLRKEKSFTKKKWKILGIKIARKRYNKNSKLIFPSELKSIKRKFENKKKYKKLAIFASFNKDGLIADYVVYYLQGLKKVVDGIIFVMDNPVLPSEIEKIKDLVIYVQCSRHEEYDFGSYKRGYKYAKNKGLLDDCNELVICNDSCYGPVYPFKDVFDIMAKKECDFWGMASNIDKKFHLQSYFYLFKRKIIKSKSLEHFLEKIKKERSFRDIVYKYEFGLTNYLIEKGFRSEAFLPSEIPEIESAICRAGHHNATVFPLTLIKRYKFPLIKVKCFTGGYAYGLEENPKDVLDFLKTQNNTLYEMVVEDIKTKGFYDKIYDNDIDYLMQNCKIVSFDIFDTLLIRPYAKPTDVFIHIENVCQVPGFYKHRVEAEQRARMLNPLKEDITLDDIYMQILPKYVKYKEKELLFEERVLRKHPTNYKLYQKALKQHKKIIVTSDMYLPTDFLRKILILNGYNEVEKLYISGDYNKAKYSGNLFQQILKDFNIQPEELLHVGDNESSDVIVPNRLNIKTYYVQKYIDYFNQFGGNKKYINFYNENQSLERSIIISQIARHQLMNKSTYWEDIGYCLAGPLALGYTQKIVKEAKLNKLDCLLFVSRDGYLLQKVYNQLADDPLENHYIYAPRIFNLRCFGDYRNNSEYFKKLVEIISKWFPKIKNTMSSEEQLQFIRKNNTKIQKYYEFNIWKYSNYLKSLDIKGSRIASVDMTTGAFSSEKFLKKFLKDRYSLGFFSATFTNDLSIKFVAYMDTLINPKKQEGLMMLMELLITAPEPPIVDIEDDKPIYKAKNKYDEQRINIVKQVEVGMSEFIKDYVRTFDFIRRDQLIEISMDANLSLLNNYTHAMSNVDIAALKQVYHSADIANDNYVSLYDEIVRRN